jgi:hypothetical protein
LQFAKQQEKEKKTGKKVNPKLSSTLEQKVIEQVQNLLIVAHEEENQRLERLFSENEAI